MRNKCLGVFLVFITIPLIMISIFSLASLKLFNSQYYKDLLDKSNTFVLIIKAIPPKTAQANPDDLIVVIQNNITSTWLKQNVDNNFDNIFLYLNNNQLNLNLSIDIRPFKGEFLANAPAEVKNILPEELSFSSYIKFLEDVKQLSSTNQLVAAQTNSATLNTQIFDTQNTAKKLDQNSALVKKGYAVLRIVIWVISALAFLMLIIIALASRHWLPAVFRWMGATLFIAGVLNFSICLLTYMIMHNYNFIAKLNVADNLKMALTPLYQNITTDIITRAGTISLIIGLSGLILLIISYILPKFIPPPPPIVKPAVSAPANN